MKRFEKGTKGISKKIEIPLEFPEYLDLTPFTPLGINNPFPNSNFTFQNQSQIYQLISGIQQ
jgi:hypothetical protein